MRNKAKEILEKLIKCPQSDIGDAYAEAIKYLLESTNDDIIEGVGVDFKTPIGLTINEEFRLHLAKEIFFEKDVPINTAFRLADEFIELANNESGTISKPNNNTYIPNPIRYRTTKSNKNNT